MRRARPWKQRHQEPIYTQRKSLCRVSPHSGCGHAYKKLTEKARSFPKTRRQGRESAENREGDHHEFAIQNRSPAAPCQKNQGQGARQMEWTESMSIREERGSHRNPRPRHSNEDEHQRFGLDWITNWNECPRERERERERASPANDKH